MSLHPTTRTTFSTQDYAEAVRIADPSLTREQAGVLWAQYALETGRGKACWNANIGNVKATPAQVAAGVDYFMLPNTWEILHGRRVVFQPPDPQTWFRHFTTLGEAMAHHIVFLRDRRYKPAWPAVLSGDPETFARELKRLGYYTASADVYATAMAFFHAEWMRVVEWSGPETAEPMRPTYESGEIVTGSGGIIHGTHIVDWALEQREREREAELDALLGGFGRYEEAA